MKTCPRCSFAKIADSKNQCPSCKTWIWGSGKTDKTEESIWIEDVNESEELDRIKTGLIDECLFGGVYKSDVILIGGGPGAGKSTLMLQLAAVIAIAVKGECLYIGAEEDNKALKRRYRRLGIKVQKGIRLVSAMSGVADIGNLLMSRRPKAIILDSINKLSNHDDGVELEALKTIKSYAVELQAPAFVVSQINSEGDFKGLMAKQHEVDVLLTFEADEEVRSENGEAIRKMQTIKNRSGQAYIEQFFEMTATGLRVISLKDVEELETDPEEESEPEPDESEPVRNRKAPNRTKNGKGVQRH